MMLKSMWYGLRVQSSRRAWGRSVLFLMLATGSARSGAGWAAAPPEDGGMSRRLAGLRVAIRSLEVTEETTIRDERPGKPAREQRGVRHLIYRVDLGRTRSESAGSHPRVEAQRSPPPGWVFELPDMMRGRECRVRRGPVGPVIAVAAAGATNQSSGKPMQEMELSADRLPVHVLTYGARGEVLDEITVRWRTEGGVPFPGEIEYRYHSVENTLIRTVTYRAVRMNSVISATLFTNP